ncbi:hypothetical protein BU23DRAFT_637581, partial [Bimuria novae-zelandiae CBS 107.79]
MLRMLGRPQRAHLLPQPNPHGAAATSSFQIDLNSANESQLSIYYPSRKSYNNIVCGWFCSLIS